MDKITVLNRFSTSYGEVNNNPRAIVLAKEALDAMTYYARLKIIEENKSILAMAEAHMDERACMVLRNRIFELEEGLCQV